MSTRQPVLVRARALTGFAELVEALNGEPLKLLADAGIPASALNEPESTLPLESLARLLEDAATSLRAPDFGLQLAERQDISVVGAIALIARYAATVGDALRGVSRHLPYHTPGIRFQLVDDPRSGLTEFQYWMDVAAGVPRRQGVELSLAVVYAFMRLVTGDSGAGWRIDFRHPSGLSAARYRRRFGCQVRLGQEFDRLVFPTRLLEVSIDPGSAGLKAAAERYVGNLLRRYPLDIEQQVEALVERQLATRGCGIDRVASQLGMHRRTLQRRLESQGLQFEDIIDGLRRRRADQLLPHPVIPLTQVCELLGYAEQSSFNRACRRWYGATPQATRARLQRVRTRRTS